MGSSIANEDNQFNGLNSSLIPSSSLAYSLGSANYRWKDIFVGPGTINITDTVSGKNVELTVSNGVFFINGIAQAQLANISVTNLTFSDNTLQTTAAAFYNGSFEDSTTQVSAGTTSATLITMNTTTVSRGISIDTGVTNSKITFANSGNYFISLLGQYRFSGGASNYDITMWYSKNNTIEPNSSTTFILTSGQGSQLLAKFEDIVSVNAGDYIQFYWYTSVAPSAGPNGIYLYPTAAGTNPTRPASRSVRLNVFNVG